MTKYLRYAFSFLLLFALPSAAHADWHKAESEHFVVYADDKAKDVKRFAEMLESYHSAMEFVTRREIETPSPSSRVTIYAVGSERKVRKLYGGDNRFVAGFYNARASGSVAFVPDVRLSHGNLDFSVIVLLHEYAHHFLISSSRYAMPRWLSEGAAEFFASAKFEKNGKVWVGRPATHRAAELAFSDDVSIEELFDHELYEQRKSRRHDEFYGRSWTLYHYLTFSEARQGQLTEYMRAMATGRESIPAATEIFGDLDVLDSELERYLKSRRMTAFALKPELLSPGEVTVGRISDGHAEMMPLIIRSRRGVTREQAEELLVDVQEVAAQFPADAEVLAALAEAEHDAGNYEASIAAADKAISIDPEITNSYVQKGYSLFRLAEDADDIDAAMKDAMKPFSQLNGIENNHPLPLMYYYRSFVERGAKPNETARHAIERAAQLAPFDKGLWMTVGHMQAMEGKIAIAAQSLASVANDPHGGEMARYAKAYRDALKNAPEGEPFNLAQVLVTPEVEIPQVEAES